MKKVKAALVKNNIELIGSPKHLRLWANRVPQFIIGCGEETEKFTFLVKNPPRKISPENKSFDTTNVLIELVNNQEAMFIALKKPLIPS